MNSIGIDNNKNNFFEKIRLLTFFLKVALKKKKKQLSNVNPNTSFFFKNQSHGYCLFI